MSHITFFKKYKSPMEAVCEIAANPHRRKDTFSMADYRHNQKVLAKVAKRREKIDAILQKSRSKDDSDNGQKWTIIRKLKKDSGFNFHATGLGNLKAANFAELKTILKENGYTNFRMGIIKGTLQ